jgi:transposase
MRPQKPFPNNAAERLEKLLASSGSVAERCRLQCVYLRAKYGYSAEQIAKETGLKLQTVRNIHSLFLKNGEAALKLSGKGGRKNFHLDLESETALLAGFEEEAKSGGIKVSRIQTAYQKMVGKKLPSSTIYRMLHRHGWRKFAYRPGFWYPPEESKAS